MKWDSERGEVMCIGKKYNWEEKEIINVSLKPLCWRERSEQTVDHPELRTDETPLLECHQCWKSCAKRSCGKGTSWNSYEVSKRTWVLRSCRSIELGALSCSRGQPKVAHGNYFYHSGWKGNQCGKSGCSSWTLSNAYNSLTLCCPCCTCFWVSRVSVWSAWVTDCCAMAWNSGCHI